MKTLSKLLVALFLLMAFPQSGEAAFTANKQYNNQTTGSNVNTWGIVLNSNFTTIDSNLGGTLTLSVAGSSNVTLSVNQSANLIYNFTGVLTGNINVIFPAAGGLYFINNQTTGAYTLTIQAGTSTSGITVPQGQSIPIVVDNSTSPPTVDGASGTQSVYTSSSVSGTANAITINSTTPSNFTLAAGDLLTFAPVNNNTDSTTITTPDGATKTLQKITFGGLANVTAGDLISGVPILAEYNGTVWIGLDIIIFGIVDVVSTNQSINFASNYNTFVNTSAIVYTIAETTNFTPWWYIYVDAQGGAATITPNASDAINVNGTTLSTGTSYIIPQGIAAKISTDANGNLYILFNGAGINTPNLFTATQSVTPTTLSISTATFTPTFGTSNSYNAQLIHASCPCTIANPSGTIVPGTDITISVQQSSTGSDTVGTWGSYYKFPSGTAPTLSTTASDVDVVACHVWSSTDLLCNAVTGFAP